MTGEPVIFRFQFWKALFFGVVTGTFFCVLFASLIKAAWLGDLSGPGFLILMILAYTFGSGAIDYLRVAAQNPVAVRMDAQGLSCYKMPPVAWPDVKAVAPFKGRKRHRYLGITLHDPQKFQAGLPRMARIRSKIWQWRYGQDIVVEGFLLKQDETEEIAQAAHAFLDATT